MGSPPRSSASSERSGLPLTVPPAGLEPALPAPEAGALSSELRGHGRPLTESTGGRAAFLTARGAPPAILPVCRKTTNRPRNALRVVLLVDDDPVITRLLEVNFRLDGFKVGIASRGDAALERARAVPPDAIVLDVMLPGLGGFEVARQMRAIPNLKDVPVVFLTARATRGSAGGGPGSGRDRLHRQALRPGRPGRAGTPAGRRTRGAVIEERLLELIRSALEAAAPGLGIEGELPEPELLGPEAEGPRRLLHERGARPRHAGGPPAARGGGGHPGGVPRGVLRGTGRDRRSGVPEHLPDERLAARGPA